MRSRKKVIMIIYEVNLGVENQVAESFAVWLRRHVPDIVQIGGFLEACWYYRDPEDGRQRWTIHYHVADWKTLRNYLDQHAESARKEGTDLFGDSFSADRRILFERERFGSPEPT